VSVNADVGNVYYFTGDGTVHWDIHKEMQPGEIYTAQIVAKVTPLAAGELVNLIRYEEDPPTPGGDDSGNKVCGVVDADGTRNFSEADCQAVTKIIVAPALPIPPIAATGVVAFLLLLLLLLMALYVYKRLRSPNKGGRHA
jgi:hypothetical protein